MLLKTRKEKPNKIFEVLGAISFILILPLLAITIFQISESVKKHQIQTDSYKQQIVETSKQIEESNKQIEDLTKKLESISTLSEQIDTTNNRINNIGSELNKVNSLLGSKTKDF